MWLKSLILFSVLYVQVESTTTTTSLSSVNWMIQQIVKSEVDREIIIRGLISNLQPAVNAAITNMKPTSSLASTVKALEGTRDLLLKTSTVFDYGYVNSSLTCSDATIRKSNISYDIQRCLAIRNENVANLSLTLRQYSGLNAAYVVNFNVMADTQRSMTQAVLTSLYLLYDAYTQYSLTLARAVAHYREIVTYLYSSKTYYCTCLITLSTTASSTMVTVDSSLRQIQTSIAKWEANVRNQSSSIISISNSIKPDLKTNTRFIKIANGLESIVTLLSGYLNLSNIDTINSTTNCEDLALKIAYIRYEYDQYRALIDEVQKNSSFVLSQYSNLNTNYLLNYVSLSTSQRTNITKVLTGLKDLIVTYQQYIVTYIAARSKLAELLYNSVTNHINNCKNCTNSDGNRLAIVGTTLLETSGSITTTSILTTTSTSTTTSMTTGSTARTSTSMTTASASTSGTITSTSFLTTNASSTATATKTAATTTVVQTSSISLAKVCDDANMLSFSLSDSSKTYIKSVCFISKKLTQAKAAKYCVDKGMYLFSIGSSEIQKALFASLTKFMGTRNYVIRINGIRNETGDGTWSYNSKGKSSAFSNLDWLVDYDTYQGEDSMVITNMAYPMEKFVKTPMIDGVESNILFPFACEYKL